MKLLLAFLLSTTLCYAQRTDSVQSINLKLNLAGQRLQSASTMILAGVVVSALGAIILSNQTAKDSKVPGYAIIGVGGLVVFGGYIKIGRAGKALRTSR